MAIVLVRSTLGRLVSNRTAGAPEIAAGISTALNVADWTPRTGITVSIVSGFGLKLDAVGAASNYATRHTALASRADVGVYARWNLTGGGGSFAGIAARINDIAAPTAWVSAFQSSGASSAEALREVTASATVQQHTINANRTLPQTQALWVRGTVADAYFAGPNTAYALTGIALTAAGRVGFWTSSGSAYWREFNLFDAFTSWLLVVNGPAGNWRARVKNAGGTILASADAVAGVATVNLWTARYVPTTGVTLEIYDLDAAAVMAGGTAVPSETLWGGDIWSWTTSVPVTPDAPVVANPGLDSLDLSWAAVPTATSYEVDRSLDGATGWANVYTGAGLGFTDSGLAQGTQYFYRLRAFNTGGASDWSFSADGTTVSVPDVPEIPTVGAVTLSEIPLTWAAVVDADYYEVYRSLTAVGGYALIGSPAVPELTDVGLPDDTTYFYRVSACNSYGCSAQSGAAEGATLAQTVPDVPGLPVVVNEDPFILGISWDAVALADYYIVQKALSAAGPWVELYEGAALEIWDGQLLPSTEYFYRLIACNQLGCSLESGIASETTPDSGSVPDVPIYTPRVAPIAAFTPVSAGSMVESQLWAGHGVAVEDPVVTQEGFTFPMIQMESGEPFHMEDNTYLFEEGS